MSAGILQFSKPIYTITESGNWIGDRVTVIRTDGSEGEVSVKVTGKTESATVGKDVEKISQVLTWANGDTNPKFVDIKPVVDKFDEDEEFLTLTLGSIKKAKYASVKTCQVVIIDDAADAAVKLLKMYPPSEEVPTNPTDGYSCRGIYYPNIPENWYFTSNLGYWLSEPYFYSGQLIGINKTTSIPIASIFIELGNSNVFLDSIAYNLRVSPGLAEAGAKWTGDIYKNNDLISGLFETTSLLLNNNQNNLIPSFNLDSNFTLALPLSKLKNEFLDLRLSKSGNLPDITFTYTLKYRKIKVV